MRIGIIFQSDDLNAAERIFKTRLSLAAAGHRVFLLCNKYDAALPDSQQIDGLEVVRLTPTFRRRRLNRVFKYPAFCNPLWLYHIHAFVRRYRLEALQVIDLPLALAAIAVGRLCGIPVVYDMWENYPEALRGWSYQWHTLLFKNYRVARLVDRLAVRWAGHIITVVEEQKARLVASGVPAPKISVVTNAVDMSLFTQAGSAPAHTLLDRDPEEYKLVYVGVVTVERGLEDIIRAMQTVAARIPKVRMYIVGSGPYEPALRRITAEEGVEELVVFVGRVPFAQVYSYVEKSDLGLIPHLNNDFINTTIPNKLFQYMAMGKPLLVSNAKPLARIVGECGCGFVFESGNPADAACKILAAWAARNDPRIGENGRRAVHQKYNWQKAAEPMLELYRTLEA